jgi:predicted nucleic acid-binding protein
MNTAVDTSVLLTIMKQEEGWEAWSELLRSAAGEGRLLVCPIVYAELSGQCSSADTLLSTLHQAGLDYDPFSSEAAHLAGQMFQEYRSRGGPRNQLIPDFMVAAHAMLQGGRLAAIDRGYYRRCFKGLRLLQPEAG